MKLVIHRGAHEVGGSCVELSFKDSTILLDVGLPLSHNYDDDIDSSLPQPLFQDLRQGAKKVDAVILSHAHLDHYGLAGVLPQGIPVFCGEASVELMALSKEVSPKGIPMFKSEAFQDRKTFQVGDFSVTPYLMDHSAFDAYGFLINSGGKSIFYTGDFRGHGRKSRLFKLLLKDPPKVDVLLMEGTLFGERSEEQVISEYELEEKFVKLIEETNGIVLVTTGSQNIDRLVTIFRATQQTNRMLILDFYTAEVLGRLKKYARVPQVSWPRIKVCYPQRIADRFERIGLKDILKRHRKNGISWKRLNEIRKRVVMLIRPGFLLDLRTFIDLEGGTWIYSMWHGYFDQSETLTNMKSYLEGKGVRIEELHTSGHATISELTDLANALHPKMIIPIHTFHPQKFKDHFSNVRLLDNGEELDI
jgi:ribonuclease J